MLATSLALLVGCSSSGSGKGGPSDSGSTTAAGDATTASSAVAGSGVGGDSVATAKAAVAQLTDPSSSLFDYQKLIPTTPVKIKSGTRIAVITSSLSSPVTKSYSDQVIAAAKLAGMKATAFDGQFSVQTEASLIQQAVQQKYTGITLVGVIPDTVASPLAEAKAAHIPVVVFGGYADDGSNGTYDVGVDPVQAGRAVGQYIVADSEGKAKVLAVTFPPGASGGPKSQVEVAQQALISVIKQCSGCTVTTKAIAVTDAVAPGSPTYVAALRDQPKGSITYVASGCDTCLVNFAKINTQLGRTEIKVTGGYATGPVGMSEIQSGANRAITGPVNPAGLIGLLAIDTLAREIDGQTVKSIYLAAPLVDKNNVSKFPNAIFTPTGSNYNQVFSRLWSS